MGAVEILAIVAIWAAASLVFAAGYLVGSHQPGERKVVISRRHKAANKPLSPIPGVDIDTERMKIIARAKQEFNMSDAKAAKFADEITTLGIKELGKLHQKG